MSIQITDDINNIKFVTEGITTLFPKIRIATSTYETGIWIKIIGGKTRRLEVADVTIPVVNTPLELQAAIDAMIESRPPLAVNPIIPGLGQTPDNITITTSSTSILSIVSSPFIRTACVITNIGTKEVWIAIGQTAVNDKGIPLDKNGGILVLDADLINNEAINGITKTGTSLVAFQEFVL